MSENLGRPCGLAVPMWTLFPVVVVALGWGPAPGGDGPSSRPGQASAPPAPSPVAARTGTNVVVPRAGGPVRVETADGPVWIRQVSECGSDPYPRCLTCHCDIENATAKMMGIELDCTFCHGGDPDALTKKDAHVRPNGRVVYDQTVPPLDDDLEYQQFVNPSNLRVVEWTCGVCHPAKVRDVRKSMMATNAGHHAGGLYQNGVVDTKTPIYGTFAVADEDTMVPFERGAVARLDNLLLYEGGDPLDASTHYTAVPSQACARCHLWSRGKGYRGAEGADGVYRADGCAACHMPYANDGLSRSADASIDHAEPGHPLFHHVTREVPTEQCAHCHHRGARIGLSFTGRAQMPPRLPSGPGVPGTTDERFNGNYHYTVKDTNPPDVHAEAGLHCIDCHVAAGIMGDGNIWGHMDQATKIECRQCHGTPGDFPTLVDHDGRALPNVEVDDDGDVVLRSKVTHVAHQVPLAMDVAAQNPRAACAMNGRHLKPDGGLECYSCHSSWIPNCYGCHFERDERELGLNLMTGELDVGRVRTNNKVFETFRRFSFGPNSEGRIAPYIVGCQPIADVTAPDGEKILDFVMPQTANGLSGLALDPVNPHTVRGVGEVRTCAECHRAPPSLGLGSGQYALARDRVYTAGDGGVSLYDRDEDPRQPAPAGGLIGTASARAIASLPDVVHGTAAYLYVARGEAGVAVYDRGEGAPDEPVAVIDGVDAIDVARVARYLYVVDAGVGVHVYDNEDPAVATLVATVAIPDALRAVPWGIHLLVAAGPRGLVVVDIADHDAPFVTGALEGMYAADVELYAHYRSGSAFAVRAYVADPAFGVHVVDLLPNHETPTRAGGLPLAGASGLDAYTRYVVASAMEPSREHDYLYVAAGAAGLHVFDITEPDAIEPVAAVTDLGGVVADVDVASHMAPPGADDYAILANETLGLQVVDVNDPHAPVTIGTVPDSTPAARVLVEVQQMDRFVDEQGNLLKENSHPFTTVFSRDDIVRILSASIDCVTPDLDGDGVVGILDLVALLAAWGPCPRCGDCPADLDGDCTVGFQDLLLLLGAWG
jgi:hypothetical protein